MEHLLSLGHEDISIVSYDNTFICDMVNPKLTSIDYNYDNYATKIVETTIALCNHEDTPILQLIEPALVVRNSTTVAKKQRL